MILIYRFLIFIRNSISRINFLTKLNFDILFTKINEMGKNKKAKGDRCGGHHHRESECQLPKPGPDRSDVFMTRGPYSAPKPPKINPHTMAGIKRANDVFTENDIPVLDTLEKHLSYLHNELSTMKMALRNNKMRRDDASRKLEVLVEAYIPRGSNIILTEVLRKALTDAHNNSLKGRMSHTTNYYGRPQSYLVGPAIFHGVDLE
jgi:hypothetical protein